jgi:hypothetical protein
MLLDLYNIFIMEYDIKKNITFIFLLFFILKLIIIKILFFFNFIYIYFIIKSHICKKYIYWFII